MKQPLWDSEVSVVGSVEYVSHMMTVNIKHMHVCCNKCLGTCEP